MASLPTGSDISSIFEEYIKTARALVSSLHPKMNVERSAAPAYKTRKADARGEKWLAKHPEYLQKSADGITASMGIAVRKQITCDTAENRLLKHLLNSTVKQLQAFKKNYIEANESIDDSVVNKVNSMLSSIQHLIAASFLKNLPDYNPTQGVKAALEKAPRFRKFYRYHLMLVEALLNGCDAFKITLEIPDELEKRLLEVDWSVQDVLVGSVASREQFKDNYKRLYYYVPAAYLDGREPVRYIALYQLTKMFGNEAGIRYYGEIINTKRLKRRKIKFPSRHRNGDAIYYAFLVNEWKRLPNEIQVKDEGVYGPRFTNLFLLQNSNQSYELFSINSETEYRLLYALKLIYSNAVKTKSECVFKVGNNTVSARDGFIDILDENNEKLITPSIKISEFSRRPRYYFNLIAARLK